MSDEIINRVANNTKLINISPEDIRPQEPRLLFDLKDWLWEGLVLKEKDFREALKQHDWDKYRHTYVAMCCTSDAIVPTWAYMLISTYLDGIALKVILGNLNTLEEIIFQEAITKINLTPFKGKSVIIRGCSRHQIPENVYVQLILKLKPVAKRIMYGEACSSVPLYRAN